MNAKIETIISQQTGGCDLINTRIAKQIRSVASNDNFPVSMIKFEEYEIDYLDKNTFVLQLSDICQDTTKISSITVFCFQQVSTCTEYALPIRFEYQFDTFVLTSSQFSIVNCESVDLSSLTFHDFQIPNNKKATLTIAITYE